MPFKGDPTHEKPKGYDPFFHKYTQRNICDGAGVGRRFVGSHEDL